MSHYTLAQLDCSWECRGRGIGPLASAFGSSPPARGRGEFATNEGGIYTGDGSRLVLGSQSNAQACSPLCITRTQVKKRWFGLVERARSSEQNLYIYIYIFDGIGWCVRLNSLALTKSILYCGRLFSAPEGKNERMIRDGELIGFSRASTTI